MFFDELNKLEKLTQKQRDARENRRLIPIDRVSQLDTGYTGRPDTDMQVQTERMKLAKRHSPRISDMNGDLTR